MRAMRRRWRQTDPLASPAAVREILDQLRKQHPELSSLNDKALIRMLRAARHVERYPATETRRGRPSPWPREELLNLGLKLKGLLARETSGRISLASFVDHYLRVLDFPADLLGALADGRINLFEAEQLARLNSDQLGVTPAEAKRRRVEVLKAHLATQASGAKLRARVNELLGIGAAASLPYPAPASGDSRESSFEELLSDYDPSHLFYDQLKQLSLALKEVRPEELTDELLDEILDLGDRVLNAITRVKRRRQKVKKVGI